MFRGSYFACAVVFWIAAVASGTTLLVPSGEYPTLQDALAASSNGDEIWVAEGTYKPDEGGGQTPGDRNATFQLENGVAVYGGFPSGGGNWEDRNPDVYETILSGDLSGNDGPNFANNSENSYHVVTSSGTDETTVLDGFTITGGNADGGSPPRCFGGGMFNESANPTVSNSTFSGNFSHNGGGMYNKSSNTTLINCIFSGNSAGDGGGMLNDESNLTLVNCIFSGNSATTSAGGMYDSHSSTTLINCTFNNNSSISWGGGIHGAFSEPTLINCILWDNTADRGSQISMKYSSIVSVSYCDVEGGQAAIYLYNSTVDWGNGNIDNDPLFMDPNGADNILGTRDDNLRLLAGSPCVDSGDNSAVPPTVTTDLDGNPRFTDDPDIPDTGSGVPPVIDMGAYEGPKNSFLLSTESVTIPEGGTATVTVAIMMDPFGTVEVNVTSESGDPDIRVQSGASLIFDSSNYSVPQIVTLSAAEDDDNINGKALIAVNASGFFTAGITSTEEDNEPNKNILFVDISAKGKNNGANWKDALTDLQKALGIAATFPQFEQILVAQGVYRPAETGGCRMDSFQLVNGVAIYGGFPPGGGRWKKRDPVIYETILSGDLNDDDEPNFINDGENSYHVVTSSGTDETTVLDGFTITGGNADGVYPYNEGGGIYNQGGEFSGCSPTISNCKVNGNWASYGGGMLNHYTGIVIIGIGGPGPTLVNCIFSNNSADQDGGGICNYSSNPVVIGCRFNDNSAGNNGGGIFNGGSSPTLTNCIFSGNSADKHGGGMINLDCWAPYLTRCVFSENSAGESGGGIYSWMSNPILTNCLLTSNSAVRNGGGIFNDQSSSEVTNCTLSANSADENGGGIFNYYASLALKNCVLWDNSDSSGIDESAQIDGVSYWLLIMYNCIQSWTGGFGGIGNTGSEPHFADPDNGDYHLLPDSPCIDAGDPNYVVEPNETDLDGNPRVINNRVDMGAYEASLEPLDLLIELSNDIDAMNLGKGAANSLQAKLDTAMRLLEDDNENNDIVAINSLRAFINVVEAKRGKKISQADADALIATAQEIIELLSDEII